MFQSRIYYASLPIVMSESDLVCLSAYYVSPYCNVPESDLLCLSAYCNVSESDYASPLCIRTSHYKQATCCCQSESLLGCSEIQLF